MSRTVIPELREGHQKKERRECSGAVRGPPEGTGSAVAAKKRPASEPMPDQGPHAVGLMVEERDPHLELNASVQMGGVRDQNRIEEVGGLRPPTESEWKRSLIKKDENGG